MEKNITSEVSSICDKFVAALENYTSCNTNIDTFIQDVRSCVTALQTCCKETPCCNESTPCAA